MGSEVPEATINVFARSIHREARNYGFAQVDTIRLINALMDLSMTSTETPNSRLEEAVLAEQDSSAKGTRLPLQSERLRIRAAVSPGDVPLLESWMADEYGKHFMLSCATAQQLELSALLSKPTNEIGVVELLDGTPIGAMAYLDIDKSQQRAELRKLIGLRSARGHGYAEEATTLWLSYGVGGLGLEKIYVSTLQTHLRNIRLNESVGFRVEGILRAEVKLDGQRHDVLRMGLYVK